MKTFIIAEIGINHNGDIDIAKRLIFAAKWAGADAVKFQKRTVDLVYTKEELDKPRESPWGSTNRQQKEGLEFGAEEYREIARYCGEQKIVWFASAWDLESLKFLNKFVIHYNKVPSARLGHIELLKEIAKQGKYTYISTGMSTLEEIEKAVQIFIDAECPYELMHCNSQYPIHPEEVNLLNLSCMKTLKDKFNCKIGYSGHEVGIIPSVAAVALGATSIERHITLDCSMYGSDQAASVGPNGFHKLVEYIREVEKCLGTGTKIITEAEQKTRQKLWRTEDVKI